jgi:ABC-2 type transport system permease protein
MSSRAAAERAPAPQQSLPPVIPGPSALGGDPRRFWFLATTIALTDFKLRFFGSMLGYLWQLLRPLLLFGVLYFAFTKFVRVGTKVPHYPVVLLTNIMLYTYFVEGTSAVSSLVDRENLIRKVEFPRLAVPVAAVLTATFNLALNSVVILVFALANGVPVRASWLEALPLVAALALLAVGLAMLLSALYVRYRDVKPIWDVVLQILFYGTPIIYAIESIHASQAVREVIMASPLAAILEQVRHAVIDPHAPSAAAALGSDVRLLIPVVIGAVVVLAGWVVFTRSAPDLAEKL